MVNPTYVRIKKRHLNNSPVYLKAQINITAIAILAPRKLGVVMGKRGVGSNRFIH